MNTILQYINDLLFLQDCVILPGFGGIICNESPSYFDEKTSVFYPPKKDLSFNANLSKNDALLVTYISEKENISYDKAYAKLKSFVDDLKTKIKQGHRVVFDNIGVFYKDRKSNVLFEPFDYNFLADSWGMEKFVLDGHKKDVQVKTNTRFISFLKIGLAAACFGAAMFILGSNKEKINLNRLEASIGLTNLFTIDSSEDRPEISPADELMNVNPFNE